MSICLFPALRSRIWDHWLCGLWLLVVANKARFFSSFFFNNDDTNNDDNNDVEDNDAED